MNLKKMMMSRNPMKNSTRMMPRLSTESSTLFPHVKGCGLPAPGS
jgi:hypothetical protein